MCPRVAPASSPAHSPRTANVRVALDFFQPVSSRNRTGICSFVWVPVNLGNRSSKITRPTKYQVPGETKERDAHPFSLNRNAFIKHSDVPAWLVGMGLGVVVGGWDCFYRVEIFISRGDKWWRAGKREDVQARCPSQTPSICDKWVISYFTQAVGVSLLLLLWWNKSENWKLATQSCPTLCDPMDCSLPGSSVHGILQARVLEWVAIKNTMDRGAWQATPKSGKESDMAERLSTHTSG